MLSAQEPTPSGVPGTAAGTLEPPPPRSPRGTALAPAKPLTSFLIQDILWDGRERRSVGKLSPSPGPEPEPEPAPQPEAESVSFSGSESGPAPQEEQPGRPAEAERSAEPGSSPSGAELGQGPSWERGREAGVSCSSGYRETSSLSSPKLVRDGHVQGFCGSAGVGTGATLPAAVVPVGALALQLTSTQVKIWFPNRRRQPQDASLVSHSQP